MPYISKEEVKQKRDAIKKAFPGFKFSITCQHYTSLHIIILEAPIKLTEKDYECVNPFYIRDNYTGEVKDTLQKIKDIAAAGNYTEVIDGDYGAVPSFYVNIRIGEWDKPFKYTGEEKKPELSATADFFRNGNLTFLANAE